MSCIILKIANSKISLKLPGRDVEKVHTKLLLGAYLGAVVQQNINLYM